MTKIAHIDFETFSKKKFGKHKDAVNTWRYAEDRSTGIICLCYQIDEGEVKSWIPTEPFPQELIDHIVSGGLVYAHNVQMEKAVWRYVLPRYVDVPDWDIIDWRCTQAIANYKSLPGSLGGVADILNLDVRKGDSALMKKWANEATKLSDIPAADLAQIVDYCIDDVKVEKAIHVALGDLPPMELRIWQLDQKMNEIGVRVDTELAEIIVTRVAARQVVEAEKLNRLTQLTPEQVIDFNEELLSKHHYKLAEWEAGRLDRKTKPAKPKLYKEGDALVTKPTQGARLITWLGLHGIDVDESASDTIADLLKRDDLTDVVRDVLLIRQRCAKASTAKFTKMLCNVNKDGRLKGNLRYHGATTGRWAGAGAQLHNLPRGVVDDSDALAELFLQELWSEIDDMAGNIFDAAKSCCRSVITADIGTMLLIADYAAIEARVLAWLAGEQWKLKAFREYDRGVGPDMYKLAYHKSFRTPINKVGKAERQIGKVQELALGYQGGVGAFQNMASNYGVKIGEYYDQLVKLDPDNADKAEWFWEKATENGKQPDYDHDTYVAAQVVKLGWRDIHPRVCQLWYDLEEQAIEAVKKSSSGNFTYAGRELHYILPSGRALTYWDPKVVKGRFGKEALIYKRPLGPKMVRADIYGGKWVENIVQAIARDMLAIAMVRADDAGIPMILTVHDEIVGKWKESEADEMLAELNRIMELPIDWCATMPIKVEAFKSFRYKK